MSRYYMGVDGGGTKTAAVVVDPEMNVCGEGLSGPSNHLRVGIDEAARNVARAVADALRSAGAAPLDIEYTYCGIAGSDHARHRERMIEALRHLFPRGNFTVDSDARVALTAGIGTGTGVALIAGTGSVAFGRNSAGEEARAGGWGPTLGDEGSGYSIARRALSAVVKSFDGRSPKTLLTDLLCERFDMCDVTDLPYFVYSPTTHADDIAAHCTIVIQAAQQGDATALEIFASEGRELGLTAVAVARKLRMLNEAFEIAFTGGAFRAGELLLEPVRRAVLEFAQGAVLRPATDRPVIGAARMAAAGALTARPSRRP
jgi:N-acetylglucosamine kinase-like BadF-type ATPase